MLQTVADGSTLPCCLAVVPVPPHVAPAAASTLPTVFLTADACLNAAAAVQPGQTVLIHAATGKCGAHSAAGEATAVDTKGCVHYCPLLHGTSFPAVAPRLALRPALAGGLGLAAVQVAAALGASSVGTAGSPSKRAFLRSYWQGVPAALDSRSTGNHMQG